ncbi:MAG TPA: 5-formyltetrahydrofolate cyclo-ligase [Alphaproteobacteria bacterium]|nr:5-formyltetrahydrofolate cyclo-ligase [Alphaproteobacteria bacterium]
MTLSEEKKAARLAAIARRDQAHAALADIAPDRVAAHFAATFRLDPGAVVSAYWPGRTELDIRPLAERLHRSGHPIGLPVVLGRGRPLVFRLWRPGDVLEPKPFGLQEPYATAPEVTPQVLLVPFLSFDRSGYRIGYGAGYYDRTLATLRARRKVLAIGVGYAAQGTDRLPHDAHDQPLDWVVTEEGPLAFDGAKMSGAE